MFTIGYVIKKLRKEQKITQEMLCDGICTPSYLSKIENGDTNVAEGTINALLQRLGQDSSRYLIYKTEKELELQNKLYRLRQHFSDNKISLHYQLLKELMNEFDTYSISTQQFLMLHTYINMSQNENHSPEELLTYLTDALYLTKRNINFKNISNQLFTQDEIMLLINIAMTLNKTGQTEIAFAILENLRIYLEDIRISSDFKRRPYPIVLVTLSNWLGLSGRYYESLALCDKGIQYCIDYSDLQLLSKFTYNKGYCLGKLGSTSDAVTFVTRAYHVAMAANQFNLANHYKEHLLKNYNIEL